MHKPLVTKFDSSEKADSYIYEAPNGAYIRLSRSAYQLVTLVQQGLSFEEIAMRQTKATGAHVTPQTIQHAYEKVQQSIVGIEQQSNQRNPEGFWLRFTLIPQSVVMIVSRLGAHLFNPFIAILLVLFSGFVIGYTFVNPVPGFVYDTPTIVITYLLFVGSILIHEFGHTSASVAFGVRPKQIGFTMYLIMPAFFSDVTHTWQLDRWKRVVVDCSGMFFQLLCGAVYLVLFKVTHSVALFHAFVMIGYSCVFSLNPVFKFDGYWILSDALGVSNLGQQFKRISTYLLRKIQGKSVTSLPWNGKVLTALVVYGLLSLSVWLYCISLIIPLLWSYLEIYPDLIRSLITTIQAAGYPSLSLLWQVMFSTILLVFFSLLLWRSLKRLVRFLPQSS